MELFHIFCHLMDFIFSKLSRKQQKKQITLYLSERESNAQLFFNSLECLIQKQIYQILHNYLKLLRLKPSFDTTRTT